MSEKLNGIRLNVEIPKEIHKHIKMQSVFQNITIRVWVLRAIMDKIKKEKLTE